MYRIAITTAVLIGMLIAYMVGTKVQAQDKPFNVYTTPTSCVFISGNSNPAMVVVSRTQMVSLKMDKEGELQAVSYGLCE